MPESPDPASPAPKSGAGVQTATPSTNDVAVNGAHKNGAAEIVTATGRGGGGFSFRNLRTFSSMSNPVFRLYYASMLGQMGAMNIELIARSLLIYRMTNSGAILGIMALAQSLPMLFLALFGGVMADRIQKRTILIIGQVGGAASAFLVALALIFGFLSENRHDTWWILIVAAVVKGIAQGFMLPARQAVVPEIVRPDQVMNAVALNNFGQNILRLGAPAFAGFMVDFFGFMAVYLIMTVLYLESLFTAVLMPRTRGRIAASGKTAMAEMKEGLRYVRKEPSIMIVLVFTLFVVMLSQPYMQMLPIFTEKVLGVGASGMGILVSVSGIGAVVASLILASLPDKKRGLMLLASCIVMGLALIVFSFSPLLSLSMGAMIFIGMGQTGRMTLANALLQTYTVNEYRGRVMSLYMIDFAITSIGVFFVGLASDIFGVQWSVGSLAIALVVLSIAMLFLSRRMRVLD